MSLGDNISFTEIVEKGVTIRFANDRCIAIAVFDVKPRVRPRGGNRQFFSTTPGYFVNPYNIVENGCFTSSQTVERAWVVWLVHRKFYPPGGLSEMSNEYRRRWYQRRYGVVMEWLRHKPNVVYLGTKK